MKTTTRQEFGIRKNDMVQVIAGREKGKNGKVLRVLPKSSRVVVEKINLVKRHVKPSQQNPQGGITEKEGSIHYSNIQLLCPKCNRGVRFGVKVKEDGKGKSAAKSKVRVCRRCETTLG